MPEAAAPMHVLRRVLDGLQCLHPRRRRRHGGGAGPPPKARVAVRRFGSSKATPCSAGDGSGAVGGGKEVTIRVATFNAAMFSMAPAVAVEPAAAGAAAPERAGAGLPSLPGSPAGGARRPPKGILKAQAGLARSPSKARVSINLQDNEISLERSRLWRGGGGGNKPRPGPRRDASGERRRSVEEVLREAGADIIGLQNVRAEEGRGMRPLSELAEGLGMRYVFAESWAPEYGNAVLSRWPIKRWKAHRVADQSDFRQCRNVLRATIEVPEAGEINFHCTHLDHLDEGWRMKQVDAIIRSADGPHILAGGLNALDGTDYSADRWADIVKYYEEIGKPTPKVEVMKYLKGKQYVDAKDFAGECEAVVVVAKGQDVQGTCKYGTRVDYILASPNSPYKFVPGSYTVISSKGTSDHHIVRVDVTIPQIREPEAETAGDRKQRVVRMNKKSSSRNGIWDNLKRPASSTPVACLILRFLTTTEYGTPYGLMDTRYGQ
ncbi:hypothetical protein U9M48_016045 [Paspalum notatum var. saurae]|uniref:Endonuclease/exonuclease/phosphatase domain-containing protein n=1 Tax=Paspalum notatum var. saurae TaxID=547442 RepID=A0AAQ3T5L5_PASNO